MSAELIIKNLHKYYHDKEILKDISFEVEKGEFLSILGPSGCGKTTLLRILVGISSASKGEILKQGSDISKMTPAQRGMGLVFQNYALFPNMSVLDNVAYPLKLTMSKSVATEKAREIIRKVHLDEHIDKKPAKLSGGQQQRVAIARTLVRNPEIILFDEPLSALDTAIRVSLREEIKSIQKEFNVTMIYVTHDQEEAFSMSDRIMVMNRGEISQIDTPKNIYINPQNEFIEDFVVHHIKQRFIGYDKYRSWENENKKN